MAMKRATAANRVVGLLDVRHRLVPYLEAWGWQQTLVSQRLAWQREGCADESPRQDALLLVEHPSVYTLGRGSTIDNLKFDHEAAGCPHEVRRVERGGEVTWHGPGQLVVYPILDLHYHRKDLHWYLRSLEEVLIRTLASHGLEGERDSSATGVWVRNAKIAAIGLNASRWVTMHGFSLNVAPDMRAFKRIIPCGIADRPVTCIHRFDAAVSMDSVRDQVLSHFKDVFGPIDFVQMPEPAAAATTTPS